MKLALITGGSKGLGKALVDLYSANGWEVKEFSRTGTSPHHIDCDFSNSMASASAIPAPRSEVEAALAELKVAPLFRAFI